MGLELSYRYDIRQAPQQQSCEEPEGLQCYAFILPTNLAASRDLGPLLLAYDLT